MHPNPMFRADDEALLSESTRARLAREWAHIGALEHASVASFARFTLQLMALGAPADLLAESAAPSWRDAFPASGRTAFTVTLVALLPLSSATLQTIE